MRKKGKKTPHKGQASTPANNQLIRALALFQSGRTSEAKISLNKILASDKNNITAMNHLGVILAGEGDVQGAAVLFEQCVKLNPVYDDGYINLGVVLKRLGRLPEAIGCYLRSLMLVPSQASSLKNIANALSEAKDSKQAEKFFKRALHLNHDDALVHESYGHFLYTSSRFSEAVPLLRRALQLNPSSESSLYLLAESLQRAGFREQAAADYLRYLRANPADSGALSNAGVALSGAGRHLLAIGLYRKALHVAPGLLQAAVNLGDCLQRIGDYQGAENIFRWILDKSQDKVVLYNNLGFALYSQGKTEEAIECFQRVIGRMPDYAPAYNNLGNIFAETGRLPEAIECFSGAVRIKPDYAEALGSLMHFRQQACDWDSLAEVTAEVTRRIVEDQPFRIQPWMFLCADTTQEAQLVCARKFAQASFVTPGREYCERLFAHRRAPKDRLRLGYLSADYFDHATAYLAAEIFELHDRSGFEVFAFSYGKDDKGVMRQRIMQGCDHFIDIAPRSHPEAAEIIRNLEIDILMDLKGYTKDCRPEILSFRPAPIQVNYLGFPGTMGAEFIDYIITDDFITPPGYERYLSEKPVFMPGSYQVNDRKRAIADREFTRVELGLPEEGFVFCSFNNNYKITPEVFDIWTRILQRVPGSVLWLLRANPACTGNLKARAGKAGVGAERIVFAGIMPQPEHLARLKLGDLFLDTYPVNAHTTASDALWAGLPVLTRPGRSFVSRVAGSLLTAIGLPELITGSPDEYEELAVKIAMSPEYSRDLRARLGLNRDRTPLFDSRTYVANLETACRKMWENFRSGNPPAAIRVE